MQYMLLSARMSPSAAYRPNTANALWWTPDVSSPLHALCHCTTLPGNNHPQPMLGSPQSYRLEEREEREMHDIRPT